MVVDSGKIELFIMLLDFVIHVADSFIDRTAGRPQAINEALASQRGNCRIGVADDPLINYENSRQEKGDLGICQAIYLIELEYQFMHI